MHPPEPPGVQQTTLLWPCKKRDQFLEVLARPRAPLLVTVSVVVRSYAGKRRTSHSRIQVASSVRPPVFAKTRASPRRPPTPTHLIPIFGQKRLPRIVWPSRLAFGGPDANKPASSPSQASWHSPEPPGGAFRTRASRGASSGTASHRRGLSVPPDGQRLPWGSRRPPCCSVLSVGGRTFPPHPSPPGPPWTPHFCASASCPD